jgi:hypothetical protein
LFVFFAGLLLLAAASGAWASTEPTFPKGWQVHHPIHIRGGVHKGIHPDSSPGESGYTPAQIRHAYGIDQLSNTGAGQTIAIIDAYGSPTIQNDLAAFDHEYNLPAASLTIAYPNGEPAIDPTNTDEESWEEETSLDVEWAHSLAPNASILLVVAISDEPSELFSAVQYANNQSPQIMSMSWGYSEASNESSYDSTYFSHSGTIYLAASGDSGTPIYPASSPKVIAVGGTSLPLDVNGNLTGPETVWDDSSGSSGGGVSSYETQPSWQTSFGISFSSTRRCTPDVAFDADPVTGVNVYFNDSSFGGSAGWLTIGGTSLSVQCWAAIIALADQDSSITNAGQALYHLAGSQSNYNPDGAYRDITSGSNGTYSAGVGYDLVTGLGSPVANFLIPALQAAPTITPGSSAYVLPYTVNVSISASQSVNQSVYYAVDNNQLTTSSSLYSASFPLHLSESTVTVYAAVYTANTGVWSRTSEASYTGIALAAPTISPDGGSIDSTQQITVTDPNDIAGDSVYYTLDGNSPGLQSNLYTTPFTLKSSATVTAAVYKSTAGWSQPTSSVFTVAVAGGGGGGGGGGVPTVSDPTVATESATSITSVSVTLNGNITSNGGANITEYGFLWGANQNNLANTLQAGTDNHFGTFTVTLSSLTGGTNYYFQAYAKNSNGTANGTVMSFTTAEAAVQQPVSPAQEPEQTFSDVTTSYWAYDAISNLSSLGYITGYPDGSFKPDGAITRAEFVSILTRALKLQAYNPPAPGFSDVSPGDWYYGSVESVVYAGIANGEGDSSFLPGKQITREEMAAILVNALSKQNEAKASMGAQTGFTDDANISSWANGSVAVAVNVGLIKGYPDNTFRPEGDATRAEACAMINSFLGIIK